MDRVETLERLGWPKDLAGREGLLRCEIRSWGGKAASGTALVSLRGARLAAFAEASVDGCSPVDLALAWRVGADGSAVEDAASRRGAPCGFAEAFEEIAKELAHGWSPTFEPGDMSAPPAPLAAARKGSRP